MSGDSTKKDKGPEGSEDKASKEYLKDYLRSVYGVSIAGRSSIQNDLTQSGQHRAVRIVSDEYLFRLLARFNDLDIAPRDGFISRAELEYACNNPRLHFDQKDKKMLDILRYYYLTIKEVAAVEHPDIPPHHGISRQDLETISTSSSVPCVKLRKRLEEEFVALEPVS